MRSYLSFLYALSSNIFAAEVENGQWSNSSPILKITSYWSFTAFKIGGADGCGSVGDGWWRLDTSSSIVTHDRALDYKKSILLAAYMAKKTVKLRCENSIISDFTLED